MAEVRPRSLLGLPSESYVLGNGLRVRLVPLPHLQSATASFFVRVGSRYESVRTNGLSHFLEHMLYRGTETHPAAHELNLAIEQLGGTLDAATHVDFTSYDLTLPPENVERGVEMLAEVIRRPLLEDLGTEKQIIREEILEDLNEDGEQIDIDNVSRNLLYPDHPLGFSIPGPLENLDRFDRRDLHGHHAAYYTALNSVLCVAGAFDTSDVRKAIERCFEDMPAGEPTDGSRPGGRGDERFAYVYDAGSQTDVRVSFHTPGVKSPELPALRLLARVLDDGLSTRVHQTICEARGLAYEAFADNDSLEDCGVFDFGASVEHGKVPRLIETILELVDGLRASPPTDEEIDKAKRRSLFGLRTVRDRPDDAAHFLGTSALFELPEQLETIAEQIERVAPEDIRRVTQHHFDVDDAHVTCVGVLEGKVLSSVRRLARA